MSTGPRWWKAVAALALVVVAASWPALLGGPVYDDRLLATHPGMDGLDDAAAVFGRHSEDYLAWGRSGPAVVGVATYRPLPMLSLILPNALGAGMLAQHLVSLAFHLGALAIAAWLMRRDERLSWGAVALLAVFALHPALAEAWQWVNGRSDAMAGLALLGFAAALQAGRGGCATVAAVAGMLSKITYLPAAVAVAVVSRRRSAWAALAVAVAVYAIGRQATGDPAGEAGLLGRLAPVVTRAPAVIAMGVESLLVPVARPMRLLAFELADPWNAFRIAVLAMTLAALAWLAVRRRWRALVLAGGAVATLLPSAWVADGFWLGFDRYLYVPACLLLLAVAPWAAAREARMATAVAGLLVLPCLVTASSYVGHRELALSLIAARPGDPTGYLLASEDMRASGADAGPLLDHLPPGPHAPPVAHRAAMELLAAGRSAQAAALIEDAAARHPGHADLRFDLLALRGAQGRWDEALALATALLTDPRRREPVRLVLRGWLEAGRVPPPVEAAVRALL